MRRSPVFRRFLSIALLSTVGLVGFFAIRRAYVGLIPPAAGEGDSSAEQARFSAAAREYRGRIVWSSNRSGNHEIHALDLRGEQPALAKLTGHPHVDTFPRFSPDRSKILFNRSREPWVSFRDPEPWDVWIMDSEGGNERRVAEFGFHASFTPDGRSIVFARSGKVVRADVEGGREQVLVEARRDLGGWLQEPDFFDDALAGTVRGGRRAFGVFTLETRRFTEFPGPGCQIAWWPGESRLLWIESSGRGGNRVVWGPPAGDRVATLIDLPGSHSHEYFPRVSRDGAWLVFGASSRGHEHDRADYEIFLWRIGSAPDTAIRVTAHTGNDQWPDLHVEGSRARRRHAE